ncbi:MAG: hypothetical protein EB027_05080, partial [Actinobacteria bacterium]|nr:hypothetical protein [Actinomycetota bacterium]
ASYVRDRGIALEICPRSNVQTGAVSGVDAHPLALLDELGFVVTVSADNRLMCATTPAAEMATALRRVPDAASAKLRWTRNAIDASFAPHDVKARLRAELDSWQTSGSGHQAQGADTSREGMGAHASRERT